MFGEQLRCSQASVWCTRCFHIRMWKQASDWLNSFVQGGQDTSVMDTPTSICPMKKHFTKQISLPFLHLSLVFSTCQNLHTAKISMFSSCFPLNLCIAILPSTASLPVPQFDLPNTDREQPNTYKWSANTNKCSVSIS